MTPDEQLINDMVLNAMPHISGPALIAAAYIREASMGGNPGVDAMVMLRAIHDMVNMRGLSIADDLRDIICVLHDDFVNSWIVSDDDWQCMLDEFEHDELRHDLG